MITISLCMIVKNEEDILERCLSCVKDLVDEIIIVDTGSSDKTKRIAEKYTKKLYDFQWIDDFSAARNYAFSKASMEYCMWLDADDILEEKDRLGFLALKQTLSSDTDIVMMPYYTAFDENDNPTFWYYRERLIRNNPKYVWKGAVHEAIAPNGRIEYAAAAVSHKKLHAKDPDRNLNIYKKMIADGRILNARELYYYARELYYHKLYREAIEVFYKFLDHDEAWIENKIEACTIMARCCQIEGNRGAALQALFKSLEYDVPRAEVCCEIGNYFIEKKQFEIAVFWFKTALNCNIDFKRGGFILPDCYQYIPALQLCVCYDKLGNYEEAKRYNELGGAVKPDSSSFLYNKKYFDKKGINSSNI